MPRIFVFLLSLTLLSGCWKVGPDYKRPEIDTPKGWRNPETNVLRNAVNSKWWHQFNDPVLNGLVEQAIQGNYNLKVAIANVEQYMGLYGSTRSNLFPQITGSFGYTTPYPVTGTVSPSGNLATLSGAMNWQIDVWGELRRANEAARANLMAQEATQRAVMLTLVSQVVQTYINIRELDRQLAITKETVESLKEGLRINTIRFKEGYTSELDVEQVRSEFEKRSAEIPVYEQNIAITENALNVLLGRNPGNIKRGLDLRELKVPEVPQGLPSELLTRRPDITQAEQTLISANAQIGVARAQYFPNISLTGNVGQVSAQLAGLFAPGANFINIGTQLLTPVFTAGKIAGQVQAAEAVQKAALASYKNTIITAFSEFENALVSSIKSKVQAEKISKQVESNRKYYRLSVIRYQEGYTDYLTELDAIRQLFDAQIQLVTAQTAILNASVSLYLSMGGGWIVEEEKSAHLPKPKPAVYFP
jgi:multidrug efflux system outer membrane protein